MDKKIIVLFVIMFFLLFFIGQVRSVNAAVIMVIQDPDYCLMPGEWEV